VTVSIIERLPVPKPSPDTSAFRRVVALSRRLIQSPLDGETGTELQASVARLYELNEPEFQHVLDTFPLISPAERSAAMRRFLAHAQR
jgi:hypothetical protein